MRETVPDATEAAYPGWHAIGYRHPVCGYFCGIFPQHEDVLLGFEFGVLLPDPQKLLEGKGTQVRFARVATEKDIRPTALKQFIRAALDLPPRRNVKLAMIRSGARLVSRGR